MSATDRGRISASCNPGPTCWSAQGGSATGHCCRRWYAAADSEPPPSSVGNISTVLQRRGKGSVNITAERPTSCTHVGTERQPAASRTGSCSCTARRREGRSAPRSWPWTAGTSSWCRRSLAGTAWQSWGSSRAAVGGQVARMETVRRNVTSMPYAWPVGCEGGEQANKSAAPSFHAKLKQSSSSAPCLQRQKFCGVSARAAASYIARHPAVAPGDDALILGHVPVLHPWKWNHGAPRRWSMVG